MQAELEENRYTRKSGLPKNQKQRDSTEYRVVFGFRENFFFVCLSLSSACSIRRVTINYYCK